METKYERNRQEHFLLQFLHDGNGIGLYFLPNLILGLFGFTPTTDIWVRMLGLLAFCTGMLYFYSARTNQTGFFRITVPERILFFVGTLTLVVFFDVTPLLAAVGSVDLLGALWTGLTLRQ